MIFEKKVYKPLFEAKDANFISEDTQHRPMHMRNFLYYIKDLDEAKKKR